MIKLHLVFFILVLSILNNNKICAQAEELGKVKWGRNLEQAQLESKTTGKPILILFQEIPGCSTCKGYGNGSLSQPLIVEAIETYFIPLAIHNNKTGKDKEVLDFFKEPAWNNPVVRIVDNTLKDICDRLSENYTSFGLVSKINATLIKKNIVIPHYLKIIEEEFLAQASGMEKAYVGMYCFWSGEKCYAQAPGVVATKAGFMGGSEVVEIIYNPKATNLDAILNHGQKMNCADKVFQDVEFVKSKTKIQQVHKSVFKADKESKYYIYNSNYKYLPMTELQANKVNLAISELKSPSEYLSPRQITLYEKINKNGSKKFSNQIGRPMEKGWYEM